MTVQFMTFVGSVGVHMFDAVVVTEEGSDDGMPKIPQKQAVGQSLDFGDDSDETDEDLEGTKGEEKLEPASDFRGIIQTTQIGSLKAVQFQKNG